MNSISGQINGTTPLDCHRSTRPTRVTTHEQLGTSLAIMAIPKGWIIEIKATPPSKRFLTFPHSMRNATDQVSCYTRWLLKMADLSQRQPVRPACHFINMVSVHTLPEDNTASTNSSTGSVPTEVLCPEDEDYDLDLPPYPLGFSHFPVFPLVKEIWFSMSTTMNQSSMEKPTIKDNSASSATLITTSGGKTKKNSNGSWSQTTSMTLSTWYGTSRYSRPRAPTWLSLWRILIGSRICQNARVSGPVYGHT